jgi:hypothetical protein
MDIIGATQPSLETPNHSLDMDMGRGAVHEWIQMALTLEEKQ